MKIKAILIAMIFVTHSTHTMIMASNDEEMALLPRESNYPKYVPLNSIPHCNVLLYSGCAGSVIGLIGDTMCLLIPPHYCALTPYPYNAILVHPVGPIIGGVGGAVTGAALGIAAYGAYKLIQYCCSARSERNFVRI